MTPTLELVDHHGYCSDPEYFDAEMQEHLQENPEWEADLSRNQPPPVGTIETIASALGVDDAETLEAVLNEPPRAFGEETHRIVKVLEPLGLALYASTIAMLNEELTSRVGRPRHRQGPVKRRTANRRPFRNTDTHATLPAIRISFGSASETLIGDSSLSSSSAARLRLLHLDLQLGGSESSLQLW